MLRLLISLVLLAPNAWAVNSGNVIDTELFQPGARWVWSYSEWSESDKNWNSPYLYEVYDVVEVDGPLVTFAMSSPSKLGTPVHPHHLFIVDVKKCLHLGTRLHRVLALRLKFYTKSFGDTWSLVSGRHKPDAFQEKFNCLSQSTKTNLGEFHSPLFAGPVFKIYTLPYLSWYADTEGPLSGVALLRLTKGYKMELIQAP